MFGNVTRQNVCQPLAPSTRAASSSRAALRLHQRNQFARDERERDKNRRQDNARHGENDFDVVIHQPRAEPALRAENQNVNHS